MKKLNIIPSSLILAFLLLISNSCKEDQFLNRQPIGVFSEEALKTKAGVQGILIGAYAGLNGAILAGYTGADVNSFSNWVLGSLTSDDAQKGADVGGSRSNVERYEAGADYGKFDERWRFTYDGVARCNDVLRLVEEVKSLSDLEVKSIQGQARALRALYYFHGTIVFGKMPWIDEKTVDYRQTNDRVLWKEMEDDLSFAFQNLPETYTEVGRVNKWTAAVLLAKIYVFQKKWTDAKPLLENIKTNGKTTLGVKYAL